MVLEKNKKEQREEKNRNSSEAVPENSREGHTVSDDVAGGGEGENKGAEERSQNHMQNVTISYAELEELKTLARERDDYLERLRRAVAEKMNLQNRIEKIRGKAGKEALREVGRRIVPIADGLARAVENAESTEGAEAICEGLRMTEQEFYDVLGELGIEPINALGEHFDPEYHDAVYQQHTREAEPNTVVNELKKGFLIAGELLRPSQVVVAVPPESDGSDNAPPGNAEGEENEGSR